MKAKDTYQDDSRTELSRPREPGLTKRMVEKGLQQQSEANFTTTKNATPFCSFLNITRKSAIKMKFYVLHVH